MSQETSPDKIQELWLNLGRLDLQSKMLEYKVKVWSSNSDMDMLSESSAAVKEAIDLLTVVHAVGASTMEVREARIGLSKQIFRIMQLYDSKMIDIKEFRVKTFKTFKEGFKQLRRKLRQQNSRIR